MLVNLKQIISMAEDGGYCIPAFNVYNMETVMGVLKDVEEVINKILDAANEAATGSGVEQTALF